MRDLILIGAGSWTRSIVPLFNIESRLLQFFDKPRRHNETWFNCPVRDTLPDCGYPLYFNAPIGDPRHKRDLVKKIEQLAPDARYINLIHSKTVIVKTAIIGKGVMIQPTAEVYHNFRMGDHVSVCGDGNFGHDGSLGDYVTAGPYVLVGGNVSVREGVFLGAGCKLLPNVTIGEGATIGAGAVVLKDVPPNQIWAGVPARRIKTHEDLW